jgi:VWFA-related protein
MFFSRLSKIIAAFLSVSLLASFAFSQTEKDKKQKKDNQSKVRPVTIPVSIFTKQELKTNQAGEILEAGEIIVKEDNEEQTILSIRSVMNTPLHIAVLIQDNLSSNINLQLAEIKSFIQKLPPDSRIMVAYLRSGTTQVTQKFTTDLDKAAGSIRAVVGSPTIAPNSPYEGIEEVLERFDALPTGRRAILLVSDGLDLANPSPGQSLELDRAILKAQRRSVAIYSFYSSATLTENGNSNLVLGGQGSLERLSEETGGRAYFQGTITPISFQPFFRDLNLALTRQFALTYLSTHPKKGFHKVQVTSTNPEIKIEHPKGYYYRRSTY